LITRVEPHATLEYCFLNFFMIFFCSDEAVKPLLAPGALAGADPAAAEHVLAAAGEGLDAALVAAREAQALREFVETGSLHSFVAHGAQPIWNLNMP
jgi:hypothetical protein